MWLNEKHIEEGLDHKNTQGITVKYNLDERKHSRQTKKQCYRMDCKTALVHKFRTRLAFKIYEIILAK